MASLSSDELSTIRKITTQMLRQFVKDSGTKAKVERVTTNRVPRYEASGEQFNIVVRVSTTNRPLVLGTVGGLPLNGYFGLNAEYLSGYLDGYYAARGRDFSFYVDVWERPLDATHDYRDGLSFILREEAMSRHIIEAGSPIDLVMERYDLQYLEIAGPIITAPDPPTIEMISNLSSALRPKTFADLFCGTGSVTKTVLSNSPNCRAVCVDKYTTRMAKQTLLPFSRQVTFVEADIFSAQIKGRFDLVFADPFDYLALDFARKVAPSLAKQSRVLVMSHGFSRDGYWSERVRHSLQATFDHVEATDMGGVAFSKCW